MAKQTKKETIVKVRFLKSPTGICNLAYNAEDKASINAQQAKELVDSGYAEYVKK